MISRATFFDGSGDGIGHQEIYFIDIFHDILYYHTFPSLAMLLVIMVEAVGTLIIGEVVFARLEGDFSEEL